MAARAEMLGDVGESGPDHWETAARHAPTCTSPSRCSPPTQSRLASGRREGPPSPRRAPRDRADLAAGLLPARDRADVVRVQGRHRPTRGRGQRPTAHEPSRAAAQGGRDRPGLPRRDRRAAAHADPGRAGPQRHLRRVPQAAHEGRGLPQLPARPGQRTARRRTSSARRWSAAGRAAPRSRSRPTATTPSSAATRGATTTSASATTRAASSARSAPTRAGPTRVTRWTRKAAWTSGCTG